MAKKKQHKIYTKAIKNWPEDERPREKLFREGEHRLSDTELLAILIRNGIKGESALDLARKILHKFGSFCNMSHTDINDWKEIKGLGQAKIAQIKAAIEIGRRFKEEKIKKERIKVNSSQDVFDIMAPRMKGLKKEIFKVLLLNSQNIIMDIVEITEGTVNQSYPIIREIFQKAIQRYAASIICVHNHPSGNPLPSQEDKTFTQELKEGAKILQINLLDHIIIGEDKYYSFSDEGLI